ncbi:MAG: hypothetical protein SPE37_01980 [Campylobacter sp.]|nr:hypothetical protein [Campylobacter sp.]MDY4450878.1 hypothetical protein [Campylobacter sp.]
MRVGSAGVLLDRFKASKEQIGLVNACFFAVFSYGLYITANEG